ncbi:uncharacterized protein GVI51_G08679 [Nakaseomyces glabratus]|uniref:Zn(2)-C6 fungal-type domain-containing protein n=2 Tax=Candida glabrata TaxID=5478 RepID=Q6FSP7_CANGA|nr:uncharacterized protein CAGL0G08844g [Nakaseomyces glabratus]KAH7587049.1 Fungal specific transcription factor domain [Nakaseomyces glabratus]KAH7589048.1 Fungal specific transcription factor domain [Nakaseomyces glabratus]KAH7593462.1 Zn(2)-C6 fungal-type DNA-binding domain profile [Nakaseomyces glabratus]KAH7602499.1 Fungal specific transcription factor domain [Nakaseomyces glabratus]KAH7603501.1 Fungal specific transcription factor domain [Nakaseomyces glabratus]|eukprot:XP_446747.1 uncharacterized protein CAGL0G08844g [[Candida] glabrata]
MNLTVPHRQEGKRRKVTRACDDCRKKKVKCDGNQPCIHCTVYSYECTYNHPLKRLQSRSGSGSVSTLRGLSNSNSNSNSSIVSLASLNQSMQGLGTGSGVSKVQKNLSSRKYNTKNAKLQAELDVYKTIFEALFPNAPNIKDIDVPTFLQIFQNFKSSAPTFLDDVMKEYNLIASENTISPAGTEGSPDDINRSETNSVCSVRDCETPVMDAKENSKTSHSSSIPPVVGREIKIILPPKPIALEFVKNTWEHCCVLLRFYHRPTFIKQMDELYETDPHNYSHEQMRFLPLCYSTMAVGALFSKSIIHDDLNHDHTDEILSNNKFLQDEGYKYFIAARKLLDITNARDLNSMQTILMMFIFLQCSARLSTCYTYIGLAMRSVLREGFHRNLPDNSIHTPLEIEMRKRLFYTIYKLDVYVNAMLGLPGSLDREDFDQELPLDLPDEALTEQGINYDQNPYSLSSTGIANEHTKLFMILGDILKHLYPIKKINIFISHKTVTDLELKLKMWLEELPRELVPNAHDIHPQYERANKLLHLAFLHVQLILYRPFIHYISKNVIKTEEDELSYLRANNSIKVSRTVVHLAQDMLKNNLLTGSYWYACYTIFYSVAGLLFYIHEAEKPNTNNTDEYYEILKDANVGREVLIKLKDSSMAAERTYHLLNKLFEKLNSKTIIMTSLYSSPEKRSTNLVDSSMANAKSVEETFNSYLSSQNPTDMFPQFQDKSTNGPLETSMHNHIQKSTFAPNEGDMINPNALGMDNNISYENNNFNDLASFFNLEPDKRMKNELDVLEDNLTNPKSLNQNSIYTEERLPENEGVRVKSEPGEGIHGVFDQLDAHLFGKYLPTNNA